MGAYGGLSTVGFQFISVQSNSEHDFDSTIFIYLFHLCLFTAVKSRLQITVIFLSCLISQMSESKIFRIVCFFDDF